MDGDRSVPLTYEGLRREAEEHLADGPYGYVSGAAGTEGTVSENRRTLDRYRIVPRVLRDVSSLDLSTRLFGREIPAPLMLAPIGTQAIYHDEGELASARAAAELGVPFGLSTVASRSIEAVADALGSTPKVFQLYWPREWDVAASYLERADEAGYDAIMLTVDSQIPTWRLRNLRNGYRTTQDAPKGIVESDPVVEQLASERGQTVEDMVTSDALSKDRALTWDDLAFVREHTDLPLVLKGILSPADARRAIEYADGIVVSNHGGRQIDGALGSAAALPDVVDAVDGEVPILFDSGIRTGADAFKAIALGADAVMLGRPFIYGLSIAGQRGVREVVENCLAELESVLGLSGHDSIGAVGRDALVEVPCR